MVGQGLALGLEVTGLGGPEGAVVRIEGDGRVVVHSGLGSQGQGQATTLAQVAAEVLGAPLDAVSVRLGDTALVPVGKGTFASRGAVVGGGAVALAAARLREQVLEAAARVLEARVDDLVIRDGRVHPRGSPAAAVTLAEIARARAEAGAPALEVSSLFGVEGDAGTYALSAHVATVAVDRRTGACRLLDYVVVHDVGRSLNPTIVEGQVHGGVVEGIGGALLAELWYDEAGQLGSGSLVDYLLPLATGLPRIRVGHRETRPTTNPCGVRGVGEGGTVPVAAAIANAVSRALGPALHGGEEALCRLPLTPERVLRACDAAMALSPNTGRAP
jgi:carbon-monoxide dehydrogenase large subunit